MLTIIQRMYQIWDGLLGKSCAIPPVRPNKSSKRQDREDVTKFLKGDVLVEISKVLDDYLNQNDAQTILNNIASIPSEYCPDRDQVEAQVNAYRYIYQKLTTIDNYTYWINNYTLGLYLLYKVVKSMAEDKLAFENLKYQYHLILKQFAGYQYPFAIVPDELICEDIGSIIPYFVCNVNLSEYVAELKRTVEIKAFLFLLLTLQYFVLERVAPGEPIFSITPAIFLKDVFLPAFAYGTMWLNPFIKSNPSLSDIKALLSEAPIDFKSSQYFKKLSYTVLYVKYIEPILYQAYYLTKIFHQHGFLSDELIKKILAFSLSENTVLTQNQVLIDNLIHFAKTLHQYKQLNAGQSPTTAHHGVSGQSEVETKSVKKVGRPILHQKSLMDDDVKFHYGLLNPIARSVDSFQRRIMF